MVGPALAESPTPFCFFSSCSKLIWLGYEKTVEMFFPKDIDTL